MGMFIGYYNLLTSCPPTSEAKLPPSTASCIKISLLKNCCLLLKIIRTSSGREHNAILSKIAKSGNNNTIFGKAKSPAIPIFWLSSYAILSKHRTVVKKEGTGVTESPVLKKYRPSLFLYVFWQNFPIKIGL